jgi:hypothetical protein
VERCNGLCLGIEGRSVQIATRRTMLRRNALEAITENITGVEIQFVPQATAA